MVTDTNWTTEGAEGGDRQWFFGYPAQCIIMIGQIEWTGGGREALIKHEGRRQRRRARRLHAEVDRHDRLHGGHRAPQLTPLQRKVIGAKLTLDVHAATPTPR